MIVDENEIERYGCIYGIKAINPNKTTNGFYVGQTVNFKSRRRQHWRSHDKAYLPIEFAVKKYGKEAFEMFVIEYCDSLETMNEAEEFWISYYKFIGTRLYNIKKGGNNHVMAQSTKDKIGLANKIRDYVPTQETREAMAASRSKPVICMDQFGVKFEFKSIRDASRSLNICVDSIADVVNKVRISTSGYTFIYKEDELNIDITKIAIITPKPKETRKIFAIDKLGNKQEFESVKQAEKILKINSSPIYEMLNNKLNSKYKTLGGYVFVFENDERDIKDILLNFIDKRAKPIISIDKFNNKIIYKSIYKASKTLNISNGNIWLVLNGKRKSANGYIFKFVNI